MRGDSGFIHPRRQFRVSELPAHQQDAAMDAVDVASERFPSVAVRDCSLHVCELDGHWQVWLNTEAPATFDGLCVSVGATRDEAVAEAVKTLEAAVEHLQAPPTPRDLGLTV